jgi:hypothetical protein
VPGQGGQSGASGIDFNYRAAPNLQLTAVLPYGFSNPAGDVAAAKRPPRLAQLGGEPHQPHNIVRRKSRRLSCALERILNRSILLRHWHSPRLFFGVQAMFKGILGIVAVSALLSIAPASAAEMMDWVESYLKSNS